MRARKIIVVGAGPAGASCALGLAQRLGRGAEIMLLDKSRYPRIKVCGSGLSPHALNQLEALGIKERFAGYERGMITSLRARGPGGAETVVASGQEAWVVPRVEFDHGIVQEAAALGVEFREGTKVTSLLRDDAGAGRRGRVRGVATQAGELEADLVVCADGSPSRFSIDDSPRTTIQTIMGWYKGTGFVEGQAWMIWDDALAGYYFWVFPEPCGVFNIGLTIPDEAPDARRLKALFQELLDRYCERQLEGAEQVGRLRGHPAIVTGRVGPISESHCAWVGEAARLVMPATVEGIGFALESGRLGAEFIARDFDARYGFSTLAQRRYQLTTAGSMLPKFWAGQAFVKAVRSPMGRRLGRALVSERAKAFLDRALFTLIGEEARAPS